MFSEESSQSEGDVRTVPTLGHQTVMLGGLYSAVEDKFLPGQGFKNFSISDIKKNHRVESLV